MCHSCIWHKEKSPCLRKSALMEYWCITGEERGDVALYNNEGEADKTVPLGSSQLRC